MTEIVTAGILVIGDETCLGVPRTAEHWVHRRVPDEYRHRSEGSLGCLDDDGHRGAGCIARERYTYVFTTGGIGPDLMTTLAVPTAGKVKCRRQDRSSSRRGGALQGTVWRGSTVQQRSSLDLTFPSEIPTISERAVSSSSPSAKRRKFRYDRSLSLPTPVCVFYKSWLHRFCHQPHYREIMSALFSSPRVDRVAAPHHRPSRLPNSRRRRIFHTIYQGNDA